LPTSQTEAGKGFRLNKNENTFKKWKDTAQPVLGRKFLTLNDYIKKEEMS
jgi:hypothetical protein